MNFKKIINSLKLKLLAVTSILLSYIGHSEYINTIPPYYTLKSDNNIKIENIIKSFENNKNTPYSGWNKRTQKWYPHHSYELGERTIAYGHKIKKGENFSKGLSELEANTLLRKDIQHAKNEVYRQLKIKYQYFGTLTEEQECMFIEFVFNLGNLGKFPIFTRALLNKDWAVVKKQYKRYSHGKELKKRNITFYNLFLKNK